MNKLQGLRARDRFNARHATRMSWVADVVAVWNGIVGVRDHYNSFRENRRFSVKLDSRDEIFPWVQLEVMRRLPARSQRSIEAITQRGMEDWEYELSHSSAKHETRVLRTYFTGERSAKIVIGGYQVNVSIVKPDIEAGENRVSLSSPSMYFSCDSLLARNAVVNMLREITEECERKRVGSRLWMAAKWGDWQREPSIPARKLDTVILAPGQVNELVGDLQKFMDSEDHYNRMGVPWHRGYTLHGPPGTGKTSVARGLSDHFGLDLYYLPLHDIDQDTDLLSLVSKVKARSILLIEDIDISAAATDRTEEKGVVSMTGLLNALDGVVTPHGLIKIMTTNKFDEVDEAVTRPGRSDRTLHIDYIVDGQFADLLRLITGEEVIDDELPSVEGLKLTPAQIIEWAKPHLGDPDVIMKIVLENVRN